MLPAAGHYGREWNQQLNALLTCPCPSPLCPWHRSGLGNSGRAVTALSFAPPLTQCGPLQCISPCKYEGGVYKCKGEGP